MGNLSPAGCLAVATSIVLLLSTPLNLFALEGTTWTTTGSLRVRAKSFGKAQTVILMELFFGPQRVPTENGDVDLSSNQFLLILDGTSDRGALTGTYRPNRKGSKAKLFPGGSSEFVRALLELALDEELSASVGIKTLKIKATNKSQVLKLKLKGKTMSKTTFSYTGIPPDEAGRRQRIGCSFEVYPEQATSLYILPYEAGETFTVAPNGNCGPFFTHTGIQRHAYDFEMPLNTTLIAARGGTVVSVETDRGNAGHVLGIEHDDGTIGWYFHLRSHLVDKGDVLKQGDSIALSGQSGTTVPHLHFQICKGRPEFLQCDDTLPVTFRNTHPHPKGLRRLESYTALPF